ncbi:MAG: phosphoglycolate phosphatase [Pseudomonadales bacterium]
MKRYDAYLFDLDGTLVDTAPDLTAALNQALSRAGFPCVDDTLTRHWIGHGARVMVEQALAHLQGPAERIDALCETFLEHYQGNVAIHSRPYPGVTETLAALRDDGARLAVVTNKRAAFSVPLLNALDLSGYFQSIVCGDTAPRPKPAPDPALHACAELGLTPAQVLFVGDSTTDVECARAAGCDVVCVADGYNHGIPPTQLGADAVIGSFLELLDRR